MKLKELKALKESFVVSKKTRKVKEYDDIIGDDVEKEVPYTSFDYTDIIGGRAYGEMYFKINENDEIVFLFCSLLKLRVND